MEHSEASSVATLENATSAQEVLVEITRSVNRTTGMNGQIASAAEEQSAVSETISRSASEIATLAEESLDAAKQTASAAADIATTGDQLGGLVKRFEL